MIIAIIIVLALSQQYYLLVPNDRELSNSIEYDLILIDSIEQTHIHTHTRVPRRLNIDSNNRDDMLIFLSMSM